MLKKLRQLIKEKRLKEIGKISVALPPSDFAEFLPKMRTEMRNKILNEIPKRKLIKLLPGLPKRIRKEFVSSLSPKVASGDFYFWKDSYFNR